MLYFYYFEQGIWSGDLPHAALTILHQHAIQADLTELQCAAVKWIAYSGLAGLEPHILARQLSSLEHSWPHEALTRQEVSSSNRSCSQYFCKNGIHHVSIN